MNEEFYPCLKFYIRTPLPSDCEKQAPMSYDMFLWFTPEYGNDYDAYCAQFDKPIKQYDFYVMKVAVENKEAFETYDTSKLEGFVRWCRPEDFV